ncbi:hypothetical protein BGX26_004296, partial [Mortierella sp. AD094]
FDITTTLSNGFQFRDEVEKVIDVVPIPECLQQALEVSLEKKPDGGPDSDINMLLSQSHLQYLYTRFLGVQGSSKKDVGKHAVWKHGAHAIEVPATPNRELKLKKLKKGKAQQKQSSVSAPRTMIHKQWQVKVERLCDTFSDLFETDCHTEDRIPSVLWLLYRLQYQRTPLGIQQHLPKPDEQLKALAQDKDDDDSIGMDLDHEGDIEDDDDDDSDFEEDIEQSTYG